MPLYEYVCASCSGKFERYVRAWGEAVSCPTCQGTEVEKQLSTFAFTGPDGGGSASTGGGCGCGRGGCGCGH
jgi:putative FmdB family regulatory protein